MRLFWASVVTAVIFIFLIGIYYLLTEDLEGVRYIPHHTCCDEIF